MLALGEEAEKKNLKVGVGLMCRHCEARQELFDRIKDGEIGDIILDAGLPHAPARSARRSSAPKPRRHQRAALPDPAASTASSGPAAAATATSCIHNIDECCWMKDAWPVKAQGVGGRHYRGDNIDQNFDTYSVEYTFADGAKLFLEGRNMDGCHQRVRQLRPRHQGLGGHLHVAATRPARCRIYKGQKIDRRRTWSGRSRQPEPNPYQLEWDT